MEVHLDLYTASLNQEADKFYYEQWTMVPLPHNHLGLSDTDGTLIPPHPPKQVTNAF